MQSLIAGIERSIFRIPSREYSEEGEALMMIEKIWNGYTYVQGALPNALQGRVPAATSRRRKTTIIDSISHMELWHLFRIDSHAGLSPWAAT